MSHSMGAMVFRAHGGPDVLEWAKVPRPEPARDEVLVKVAACGVNHLDLFTRAGHASLRLPLPHILGNEPVGTVAELGPEELPSGSKPLKRSSWSTSRLVSEVATSSGQRTN